MNASRFIGLIRPELIARGDAEPYIKEFAAKRTALAFAPAPTRAPDLADKEFLNRLFREQGLSPTALNNYLSCPWRYFFQNLVRIPGPPNASLSYGNAVHKALEQYFNRWKTSGEKPDSAYLIARFEDAMRREPLTDSEYGDALRRGREALAGYWKQYHASWNANVLTEERFTAELAPDIVINGKIDKIEKLDGGNAVTVVDYKTGKIRSRGAMEGDSEDESTGMYKRQLVFYKLLLDRDERFVMRSSEIDFVEPDRHGKFKKEPFIITDTEVAELETTITRVAREILDLVFWDTGACGDPRCTGCALRSLGVGEATPSEK